MEPTRAVVVGNIRAEMARRGWTTGELADRLPANLGLTTGTLRRVLSRQPIPGRKRELSVTEVAAIAQALDVEPAALLTPAP